MKLVLIIFLFVLTIVVLLTVTLVNNRAHFFEPPGINKRISIYFGQNTAVTSDNHVFPELRTPVFSVGADRLFAVVMESAKELNWQVKQSDDENLRAELVVTTPVFRFQDDVIVQIKLRNTQFDSEESALYIHSSSRKGRGDLAANAGHIQTLVQLLDHKLKQTR